MTTTHPFKPIPVNSEEHFRLALFGTVLDILDRERRRGQLEEYLTQFGFLQPYAERIAALWRSDKLPRTHHWRDELKRWAGSNHLPLTNFANIAPGSIAMATVLTMCAIEEDPRFSLLIEPEGGAPTLGGMTVFLNDVFPQHSTGDIRDQFTALVSKGILMLGNQDRPRVEWTFRISPAAFEILTGAALERGNIRLLPVASLPEAKGWIAPAADSSAPTDHALRLSSLSATTALLRGDSHNGRKTFLRMAAKEAGIPVVVCAADTAGNRELWNEANLIAALCDAVLMIECQPNPGDRIVIPQCPVDAPHLAIVTSQTASIEHGRAAIPFFPIDLPRPDQEARTKHWRAAGWTRQAKKLSERVLTSGHIHRIAMGSDRDEKQEALAAIERSLVSIRDPRLESTAQLLPHDGKLDDLVLGGEEREELDGLALRCQLREQLHGSSEAGVKALFCGPSGSGKTLAAKHMARDLKRPIYRVDLAATVNKYIGETEKNLEQALSAAEELDIVLLLDEGDALLAKRTDVGSSNDRYANMETNFLLQRLEAFRGIILITTNDSDRIDTAFRRRMDAIIPFRLPDQLNRLGILQRQLGQHKVSRALADEVASRCNFSGGQIHNVVMHARLLSLADKSPICDAHLVKAVKREYRKTGEHCPLRPAMAKVG